MTASNRADKLYSALSAKERALLVLQAWKEGGEEDRQVRATTPMNQIDTFNRYIDLMNSVNERLGIYLVVLRANVEQLGLISGWLATMRLWGLQSFELGLFIFRNVPEPITESDHARLKGRRRKAPLPDRAMGYAVYPDADAAKVKKLADERASVWDTFRRAPCPVFDEIDDEPSQMQETFRALIDRLKRHVPEYWVDLRGIELLVAEAAEEFGEDPALPEIRRVMEWMREELTELRNQLKSTYGEDVDLPEPPSERVASLRKIAHWPVEARGVTINLSAPDI